MINLRTDIPLKQDVIDALQEKFAEIRDILVESEQILKHGLEEDRLLTKAEVAEMLRCEPNKIPAIIPRARVSKNYVFKRSDIYSFLDEKMKRK